MIPREIVTVPHRPGCSGPGSKYQWFADRFEWFRRDRLGRRNERTSTRFIVLVCNHDSECPGRSIIPVREALRGIDGC